MGSGPYCLGLLEVQVWRLVGCKENADWTKSELVSGKVKLGKGTGSVGVLATPYSSFRADDYNGGRFRLIVVGLGPSQLDF
jgi:hypothetical protein